MCGIFGFVGERDSGLLARMGTVLTHRGPDGGGDIQLPNVSLGHRRLSIIDLASGRLPVGSCLSGGLDSTSIVCLMRDLMDEKAPDAGSLRSRLQTFSAVFTGDPIDETAYIDVAADAAKADPTYVRPSADEFYRELRKLVWHQEEPFVSTGPYAQWCVMREASKKVTVLLDGQGGDELLAGYTPYLFVYLRELWQRKRFFEFLRETWDARDILVPFAWRKIRDRRKRLPVRRLLREDFLKRTEDPGYGRSQSNLKARLLQDLTKYSLPALLRYEDKNSMAFSVESRIPYLDRDLVEWILKASPGAIIKGGWSRRVLRDGLKGVIPEKVRLRRWKVGFTTPEIRWLASLRAAFTSLFRSPSFVERPYWDAEAVARFFRLACEGRIEPSMFFWRAANVELWLREFIDKPLPETKDHAGSVEELGDALGAEIAGTQRAKDALSLSKPNPGKHLFAEVGGQVFARIPVKTTVVGRGTDLADFMRAWVEDRVKPGDVVPISEKVVAVSQGRSYPVSKIKPSWLARVLSKAVTKTPHGIGLGIPETMELALREAGRAKIIFAAAVAAVARVFGVTGVFYKIAGTDAAAIDGPTSYTLPQYNTHASLGPKDPSGVAAALAKVLGPAIGVGIIDSNDLSAKVLASSPGVDAPLVESLMADNPMGQGHEQTPVVIVRAVGEAGRPEGTGEIKYGAARRPAQLLRDASHTRRGAELHGAIAADTCRFPSCN